MGILYVLAFVLGLCVGSFANVCVFRWSMEKTESVVFKPSHCLSCGNNIKWYDNIPILSYLILKGKCRNCEANISIQYPIVEFITGCIFLLIFYNYGFSVLTLKYMFISWMFVVATITDIKDRIIPNEISIAGVVSILIFLFIDNTMSIQNTILGFLFPSIILLVVATILEKIINKENKLNKNEDKSIDEDTEESIEIIGGGDIKFLFAIGGLMGPLVAVLVLILGCVFLSIIYFPALIKDYRYKTRTYCPMMVGFIFAWLVILNWGTDWIYYILNI